ARDPLAAGFLQDPWRRAEHGSAPGDWSEIFFVARRLEPARLHPRKRHRAASPKMLGAAHLTDEGCRTHGESQANPQGAAGPRRLRLVDAARGGRRSALITTPARLGLARFCCGRRPCPAARASRRAPALG